MADLKIASCYIRLYRDYLARWVTGLGTLKAIASSVGIAGWAVWRQLAFMWAFIIAAAQVADALKDVFPFAKQHKAASELTATYANLFIDAQLEWEGIFGGQYTDAEISSRLHNLRKLQLEAERKSAPDGLPRKGDLFAQAQDEAQKYFTATYQI
jgi:hypothetical protein